MKKSILMLGSALLFALIFIAPASAQTTKKKEAIKTNASAVKTDAVGDLKKPANVRGAKAPASRGDVYGPNYSDIVVKNFTGYYIDIYVDGSYRTTVSPGHQITTWAIPGTTKLYGKAEFSDGSYLSWGAIYPKTGYEYTWSLHP